MSDILKVTGITAIPVRVIPFDLGCNISSQIAKRVLQFLSKKYSTFELSAREKAICQNVIASYSLDEYVRFIVFETGICVFSIFDDRIDFTTKDSMYEIFSYFYNTNRKEAHHDLFNWNHKYSSAISAIVEDLRRIVQKGCPKGSIRKSGYNTFENAGMSYVMTLSLFKILPDSITNCYWENYPDWLKANITALLDPSLLSLEDSAKFTSSHNITDVRELLKSIVTPDNIYNYDKRPHMATYMSWSAVISIGNITNDDICDYVALEMYLQNEWYYVYCLEKSIPERTTIKKRGNSEFIELRRIKYELELIEQSVKVFDDSSLPSRYFNIQKGLLETSGLLDNLSRLKKKVEFLSDCILFEHNLKQRKYSVTSEILLFIIAFIEIAPIIQEWLGKINPILSIGTNAIILIAGIVLLLIKNNQLVA